MLRSSITDETSNTLIQFLRYTVVGGLAFVIDLGALFVLTEFFYIHYLVSAALAFCLGLAVNYCLSIVWVFDKRTLKNPVAEFVIFGLLGVMGLGLNELLIFLLTGLGGVHYLGSKAVATALTYVWNFLSRKILLFTFSPTEAEPSLPAGGIAPVAIEALPAE
jgi:putative flippase GtrA